MQKIIPNKTLLREKRFRINIYNHSINCSKYNLLVFERLLFRFMIVFIILLFICNFSFSQSKVAAQNQKLPSFSANINTDILVFDSSPAGIIASIAAASRGYSVTLITEDRHVGGMRTSGLSMANIGVLETFGGLGREFHNRVYQYYLTLYGSESAQVKNCDEGFRFEPHVAEKIFLDWLLESGVAILNEEFIGSVQKEGTKIVSVRTDRDRLVTASVFIDASYEGDLLKLAGCSFRVGREGKNEYNESFAGITYPPEKVGQADEMTQRYVYRVCLTDVKENQVPIQKPTNYHRASYTIDAAMFRSNPPKSLSDVIPLNMLPNRKTDSRIGEWIGGSFAFPEGTIEERNYIAQEHRDYAQGYLWFLLNDESVPKEIKQELGKWGYAKDEFIDNNHWPYHIYVREARRLIGDYVMTEHDILKDKFKPDGIAIGSYMLDVHPVQYVPLSNEIGGMYSKGGVVREGGVAHQIKPYEIPYRVLLPKHNEIENLLVPVCVSSSHIAYSTIRMEPVYMTLGHAAGIAAAMSLDQGVSIHDLSPDALRSQLIKQNAIIDAEQFQN